MEQNQELAGKRDVVYAYGHSFWWKVFKDDESMGKEILTPFFGYFVYVWGRMYFASMTWINQEL